MNSPITYVLESSLILIMLYLIYLLMFANDRNFRFNRLYLLTAPLLAILLPLLHIPLFNESTLPELQTIQQAVQLPGISIQDIATEQGAAGIDFPLYQILIIAYVAGVAFFTFRFTYQIILLLQVVNGGKKNRSKDKNYALIETGGRFPTCSFFGYLLWDDTLTLNEKEKEQIRRHEEAHIRQGHSFDVMYLEILRAVFWFNPAIHGLKKSLSDVHEYLADEQVTANIGRKSYLSLLAKQILISFNFSVSNNFHQSQTSKRMKMIRNTNRKSPVWIRTMVLAPAMVVLFFVFSCDLGNSNLNENKNLVVPEPEKGDIFFEDPNDPDNEVFTVVEDQPVPYGGMEAFYEFIAEELKYPEEARKNKVEGRIFVQFVVDEQGYLTKVKTVKGIGFGCDEEGERAVRNSPKWKPGEQRGRKVKVRMILPITFSLSQDKQQEINKVPFYNPGKPLKNGKFPPEPIGGTKAFLEHTKRDLKYPEEARKHKVEGVVYVSFVIDENGNVTDVSTTKQAERLGYGCEEEAIRLIKNGPKWTPAKKDGKNVKATLFFPVRFML